MKSCVWRLIADMPEALEAVRRLYFDRRLAKQLGARGRAFVRDYTPTIQADKWHSMFQRVLQNAKGPDRHEREEATRAAKERFSTLTLRAGSFVPQDPMLLKRRRRTAPGRTTRDRILNLAVLIFFLSAIAGTGYLIFKMMITWTVKGLG